MPRTGRRPGTSGSRERILAAARLHFASEGYDGATIRGIAVSAEVDAALVRHYFGSKEGLFIEALEFPVDPARVLPGLLAEGVDGLGERLVRFFLETWDAPDGRPFMAILRSITETEPAARMMRQFLERELIARIAVGLGIDRPELRSALAGSHLVGLAMMRYVIRLEPVASADPDVLAREVGAAIQVYLSGPAAQSNEPLEHRSSATAATPADPQIGPVRPG